VLLLSPILRYYRISGLFLFLVLGFMEWFSPTTRGNLLPSSYLLLLSRRPPLQPIHVAGTIPCCCCRRRRWHSIYARRPTPAARCRGERTTPQTISSLCHGAAAARSTTSESLRISSLSSPALDGPIIPRGGGRTMRAMMTKGVPLLRLPRKVTARQGRLLSPSPSQSQSSKRNPPRVPLADARDF
jgi:hypothetical protein